METNQILLGDCLKIMRQMPDRSVKLTIGSPPYAEKGERYGTKAKWPTDDWVAWMLDVTKEAVRISSNAVVWVVNGAVKNGHYLPACEGLVWESYRAGLRCERPCIWHKNAPPNRLNYFANAWEFCLVFRPLDSDEYFDWEAIAEPPKYKAGGKFRQRTANGQRREGNDYPTGKLARPRDIVYATVGGGHMGSPLAHENEAPYPEKLIEPFIQTLTAKGDIVFEPFSGSGTTPAVAQRLGRQWLACDIRDSQLELGGRRLQEAISA